MSYFIFKGRISLGSAFTLSGPEAGHLINSRRIRPGEEIQVQDEGARRFRVKILEIGKDSLICLPIKAEESPRESGFQIHLFQALIKEKAADFIIQKATELGVASICFFHSGHSQRFKSADLAEKKRTRWNKIALEACKQSGRAKAPKISFLADMAKLHQFSMDSSTETSPALCLISSADSVPLNRLSLPGAGVRIFVGPEGGWSEDDLTQFEHVKVQMGPRTLRADTAAVSAIGILQCLYGDLQYPGRQFTCE